MLFKCIHNCILTKKNKSVEEEGLSEALVDTVLYLVVAETRLHDLHLAPSRPSFEAIALVEMAVPGGVRIWIGEPCSGTDSDTEIQTRR